MLPAPPHSRGHEASRFAAHESPALGPWTTTSLVTQSGCAEIFRAQPRDHNEHAPASYALKLLKRELENEPLHVAAFRLEATLGREISHPHLISVLDAHTDAAPFWLVMPWLEGWSLSRWQAACPRWTLSMATALARQIASALDALHRRGYLHGDVKPANIFVAANGHATLLDLGLAGQPQAKPARDEPVRGTPEYMAPEKLAVGSRIDIRSDLYSLGVILFELLAGRSPYDAPAQRDGAAAHARALPAPLRRHCPTAPPELARLVHKLLANDPLRRVESPAEVVDKLVRIEIELLGHGPTVISPLPRAPAAGTHRAAQRAGTFSPR